jgi:hypothetical protein
MKRSIALLFTLSLFISTTAQTRSAGAGTVAFVDVNVIPMDKERLLQHQTVIVRDGVIAED